jgi:hypothetical protein
MLVSVDELTKYMDIRFSNTQEDAAGYVLEGLQYELESFIRRPIQVRNEEETYVIQGTSVGMPTSSFFYDASLDTTLNTGFFMIQPPSTVYLRNTPVISVDSLTLTNPDGIVSVQEEGRDFVVQRYGVDMFRGYPNDIVTITYSGGLDGETLSVFRLMILRAAAREMQNMHDDVVGIKDLNARDVAPLQTGFLDSELRILKRYKRMMI